MTYGLRLPILESPGRYCLWGQRRGYIQIGSVEDVWLKLWRDRVAHGWRLAQAFADGMQELMRVSNIASLEASNRLALALGVQDVQGVTHTMTPLPGVPAVDAFENLQHSLRPRKVELKDPLP